MKFFFTRYDINNEACVLFPLRRVDKKQQSEPPPPEGRKAIAARGTIENTLQKKEVTKLHGEESRSEKGSSSKETRSKESCEEKEIS